jgi:hypothetical protein
MLLAASAGCGGVPRVGDVTRVSSYTTVRVLEHDNTLELNLIAVHFNSGMGWSATWLAEDVPSATDRAALQRLFDSPIYRRTTPLMHPFLLQDSADFPAEWRKLLIWVVGTDPLILAVGGPQGEMTGRHRTCYPFVGPNDGEEYVHALIVFAPNTWPALRRAKTPRDVAAIPHEIRPLTPGQKLGEILAGDLPQYSSARSGDGR